MSKSPLKIREYFTPELDVLSYEQMSLLCTSPTTVGGYEELNPLEDFEM